MGNSVWFKKVVEDWDYLERKNYMVNKDEKGRDLSYTQLKWWCYDEENSQIYNAISKKGLRKEPLQRNTDKEKTNKEIQVYYRLIFVKRGIKN